MACRLLCTCAVECIRAGRACGRMATPRCIGSPGEDRSARTEGSEFVRFISCVDSDRCLWAGRNCFHQRAIHSEPASCQKGEKDACGGSGVTYLSGERSTRSEPAADGPNRRHGPTKVWNSARQIPTKAERVQNEWEEGAR